MSEETYSSKHLGFLRVRTADQKQIEIDLDEIDAIVLSARSATISRSLMAEMGRRAIPLVVSGENYQPEFLGIPFSSNSEAAERAIAQVRSSRPRKKRIWQHLVRAKINNQARVLEAATGSHTAPKIRMIASSVQSGDPKNREAYAAKLYWKELFGPEFHRKREQPGRNTQLNYGYSVLRALVARAVASVGLIPGLGVHHSSHHNPLCLVDDLMEPYRPVVDWIVAACDDTTMSVDTKKRLAAITSVDCHGVRGVTPLVNAVYEMAMSLADVFLGTSTNLFIPEWDPLDVSSDINSDPLAT